MKKYIIGSLFGVILASGIAFGTFAASAKNQPLLEDTLSFFSRKISATAIGQAWFANGEVYAMLRGQVTEVHPTSNSFVLNAFGGKWTVSVSSDTKFIGEGFDITKLNSNDLLEIRGVVSTTSDLSIEAKSVKVWTTVGRDDKKDEKPEKTTPTVQPFGRSYPGTLGTMSVNEKSFLFTTENGKTYTIQLTDITAILGKNSQKISFGDMNSGDKVRVFGKLEGNTISARIVRDLEISK
ncbi:MAG: hypothetical protein COU07_02770 [Candidatus Harrisonbacteria bacterium CG10_big_fil_rev_8_21_14_0_10_40_38]|uniref:DUF5666 domain-containing protein n=1 Tax=Candidatus Harrisonbacteria bacterium CG10_big_fil_rev_8_21_14_0_10_40_38 TaxID=1974583 RepID=A0A2H0URT7_9BACT|nr:MAG: hypothetical protein COU07_02770 [Candidatus Harrisonbacteria bacterium CG10_big_fil_rev_8_21_14_0_10_40_38]